MLDVGLAGKCVKTTIIFRVCLSMSRIQISLHGQILISKGTVGEVNPPFSEAHHSGLKFLYTTLVRNVLAQLPFHTF